MSTSLPLARLAATRVPSPSRLVSAASVRPWPKFAPERWGEVMSVLLLAGLCALTACAATAQQTAGTAAVGAGATPDAAAANPAAGGAAAPAGGAAAPAAGASAAAPAAAGVPLGISVWSAAPGEPMPPALAEALSKQVAPAPSGALRAAGLAVAKARRAMLEMKCSDVLTSLDQTADTVLAEVSLPEARPILSEAYGLMLACADRLNDRERADKAAAALTAMQAPLPSDVALVLARYSYATQVPFGPPRAPVRVETDPPGAVVARNLVPVGVSPINVPGGNPAYDVLDIELPGMRKLRRPLASGNELVLSLRPEDRPGVLLDRAAQLPLGSDEQGAVLKQLADAPVSVSALPSRRVVMIGPKERTGNPIGGETLTVRIYDLDRKQWSTAPSDIAIGPPPGQASRVFALLGPAAAPPAAPSKAGAAAAAVVASAAARPAEAPRTGKTPFGKTKWYTWVIAGGVVALLAGILIADKVSTDKVTISASH